MKISEAAGEDKQATGKMKGRLLPPLTAWKSITASGLLLQILLDRLAVAFCLVWRSGHFGYNPAGVALTLSLADAVLIFLEFAAGLSLPVVHVQPHINFILYVVKHDSRANSKLF